MKVNLNSVKLSYQDLSFVTEKMIPEAMFNIDVVVLSKMHF